MQDSLSKTKGLDLSVPKIVKFTKQSSSCQLLGISHGSCIVLAPCYDVDKLTKIDSRNRHSKRTTIVAHRLASFGGKVKDMMDVLQVICQPYPWNL